MPWFEPGLNEDELKKQYRRLAREYHPDNHMGEGEDAVLEFEAKMKEINEEYADYFTKTVTVSARAAHMAKQDKIFNDLEVARQIQRDLYPQTKVNYVAYFEHALIEFLQNTPMHKMLEIVDIAKRSVFCPIIISFSRPNVRKKAFEMRYVPGSGCAYIDTTDVAVLGLEWKEVKKGRRYTTYKAPRFVMVHDVKKDIRYYMRQSSKVDLLEDLVK